MNRLNWILALGLALALAGCGSDDDGNNDNGGGGSGGTGGNSTVCEGADSTLAGACTIGGACVEYRAGNTKDIVETACTTSTGTFSATGCDAASKASGGCVVSTLGNVTINYTPTMGEAGSKLACDALAVGGATTCFEAP